MDFVEWYLLRRLWWKMRPFVAVVFIAAMALNAKAAYGALQWGVERVWERGVEHVTDRLQRLPAHSTTTTTPVNNGDEEEQRIL